mmetsp:Transcript_82371/g.191295  ORF Transcript_82371/g.191295 Transcript_82371/m.191295 type:complete len:406 (-) Transcript_82371:46-1263(-)
MLRYRKGCGGLFVVFQVFGAAWPHGIIPGLVSASIGLFLSSQPDANRLIPHDDHFMVNHYPFQLFAYLLGFFMVFRMNYSYRRYWHAVEAVYVMGSRWLTCACLATAADALPGGAYLVPSAHCSFFADLVHLFSLLHALALTHLRQERGTLNLEDAPWQADQWLQLEAPQLSSPGSHKLKVLGRVSPEELRVLWADATGRQLPADARVSMVISWLMRRMVARTKNDSTGDMAKTSAPILSRLYALLSDGALAFAQAKEVAEVPFPFPYHNLKEAFLWIYGLTVPVVVNAKANGAVLRFVLNFIAVWAYFALSKVGDQLEDPYLPRDPNELPLSQLHDEYNMQLLCFGTAPQPGSVDGSPPLTAPVDAEGAQSVLADSAPPTGCPCGHWWRSQSVTRPTECAGGCW